jgi:arachidonate 5-lipoxygenase
MPRMVKGLPTSEALSPSQIGSMAERLIKLVYLIIGQGLDGKLEEPTREDLITSIKELTKQEHKNHDLEYLVDYVPHHSNDDEEFCQQLLQGVNPLAITVVSDLKQVPKDMQGLREPNTSQKKLQDLINEKRLFMLDYKELRDLKNKKYLDMYFYAPIVLIYKELLDEDNSRLSILGIQLEEGSKVYDQETAKHHPFRYMLAKIFVQCADSQLHQFGYHLGISHLAIEPIIVATHNTLPKKHVVHKLLKPHFKETIGINFMARQTLVASSFPITDSQFALGTHQALEVVSKVWTDFDFFKFSFPEQLKARGFDEKKTDGVENYYYRDDGFLLWNAIGDYTKDVINKHYKEDKDVADDADVQKWAHETANDAGMKGFPSTITERGMLAHVLQIIIWNASALHSAINYPQWSYLSFVPNRPNALYRPMPAFDGKDIDQAYIKDALPSGFHNLFQFSLSWILSMPSDINLTDISPMKHLYPEADKSFHEHLEKISTVIETRNQKLKNKGKAPYVYLLPKYVAASVNI